jgi:hypothetical protein
MLLHYIVGVVGGDVGFFVFELDGVDVGLEDLGEFLFDHGFCFGGEVGAGGVGAGVGLEGVDGVLAVVVLYPVPHPVLIFELEVAQGLYGQELGLG